MIEHIRKYCPHIYDDPHDGRDVCSLLGCHCVAIDSQYSHAERGESICRVFNALPSMGGGAGKKECAFCHMTFIPSSNRQKYCTRCRDMVKRDKDRKWRQKKRQNVVI